MENTFELTAVSKVNVNVAVAFALVITDDDFSNLVFIFIVKGIFKCFVQALVCSLLTCSYGRTVKGFWIFKKVNFVTLFQIFTKLFSIFKLVLAYRVVNTVYNYLA